MRRSIPQEPLFERKTDMNRTLGFIGAGNMASAIIGGIVRAGLVSPERIYASNPSRGKLEKLHETLGITVASDNKEAVQKADIVFLCVKPQMLDGVLEEIKDLLSPKQTVVSIAAGKTLSYFEERLGSGRKLVRVMPNTPALVGAGMSAVCGNAETEKEENKELFADVLALCKSFGEALVIPERLVDVAGQVAGASPAWIFMAIEALADGAVCCGMPRDMAYRFAAGGVAGAGELLLKSGKHPGALKDMVTSPAGTTIEGVRVLEESGVRAAFMDAVIEAYEKSKRL